MLVRILKKTVVVKILKNCRGKNIWNTDLCVVLCRIPPDYAVVIYAVGVQQGGETEWNYLWEKAQNTRVASEAEIMMNALAYTQEPWLLWRCDVVLVGSGEWSLKAQINQRKHIILTINCVYMNRFFTTEVYGKYDVRPTTHLVYAGTRCHARHDLRRNKPATSAVFVKHVREPCSRSSCTVLSNIYLSSG